MRRMFVVELLFTVSLIEISAAFDGTLTVNVLPGKRECFVHEVAGNSQYELEYQVREQLGSSGWSRQVLITQVTGHHTVNQLVGSQLAYILCL